MTPKEKAEKLFYSMGLINPILTDIQAKQCALVCVNELIDDCDESNPFEFVRLKYWEEVKQELEKL